MTRETPDPTDRTDAPDVVPTEDDQGKTVVDRHDQNIGMVSAVEGDTLYVDPHPSLTDEIKAALGWDDKSDEDFPVPPGFVDGIDENVVLEVERDEEYQERQG